MWVDTDPRRVSCQHQLHLTVYRLGRPTALLLPGWCQVETLGHSTPITPTQVIILGITLLWAVTTITCRYLLTWVDTLALWEADQATADITKE